MSSKLKLQEQIRLLAQALESRDKKQAKMEAKQTQGPALPPRARPPPLAKGPGGGSQASSSRPAGSPAVPAARTQLVFCQFFRKYGKCKYGDKCKHAHDPSQVDLCKFWTAGRCHRFQGHPRAMGDHVCTRRHPTGLPAHELPVCFDFRHGLCTLDKQCPYSHDLASHPAPLFAAVGGTDGHAALDCSASEPDSSTGSPRSLAGPALSPAESAPALPLPPATNPAAHAPSGPAAGGLSNRRQASGATSTGGFDSTGASRSTSAAASTDSVGSRPPHAPAQPPGSQQGGPSKKRPANHAADPPPSQLAAPPDSGTVPSTCVRGGAQPGLPPPWKRLA